MEKIRYTKNEVCSILSIGRDALDKLIKNDTTFPRPVKEGYTRQAAVYFDVKGIHNWWNDKVEQKYDESINYPVSSPEIS